MKIKKIKQYIKTIIKTSFFVLSGLLVGLLAPQRNLLENITSDIKALFLKSAPDNKTNEARQIRVRIRDFIVAQNSKSYDTELSSTYYFKNAALDLDKTAFIFIDAWDSHPNDGWAERAKSHIIAKIAPLLQLCRNNGVTIIHAPHRKKIAKELLPLNKEINLDDLNISSTKEFDKFLKKNNIDTLVYAGYASNMCVIARPVGIIRMKQRGYKIILVRDCTLAIEMPETLDDEWVNKVTINTVERLWGVTTTLEDLASAFSTKTDSQ